VIRVIAGSQRPTVDDIFNQQPGQNAPIGDADDVGFGNRLRASIQRRTQRRRSALAASLRGSSATAYPELVSEVWRVGGDYSVLVASADAVQNVCAVCRRVRHAVAEIPGGGFDWQGHPIFFRGITRGHIRRSGPGFRSTELRNHWLGSFDSYCRRRDLVSDRSAQSEKHRSVKRFIANLRFPISNLKPYVVLLVVALMQASCLSRRRTIPPGQQLLPAQSMGRAE